MSNSPSIQQPNDLRDELWQKLQQDLLKDFPENYSANVQLLKDILIYNHIVHPAAVVTTYFTIISGLTAQSFYTEKNSSTTLYTVAIAGTGTGKDIAVKLIPKIFDIIEEKATTIETEYQIVKSKITSVGALDNIFQDKRMIIQIIDEFGDALGKMQGGGHAGELTAKLKELYSLTNGKYESTNYARSNRHSAVKIVRDYPCYILSGITTKEQLITRLKKSMLHDGFLNRFIILEGSNLSPYIIDEDENTNEYFKDTVEFFEKVKGIPNTIIELSEDAKEYYKYIIGTPYTHGSDIKKFCDENNEDFETNKSMSNRWRENALRLATAITAYEYGVKNSKDDISEFQKKSFENKSSTFKDSSLDNYDIEDPAKEVIKNVEESIIKRLIGNSTDKEDIKYAKAKIQNDRTLIAMKSMKKTTNQYLLQGKLEQFESLKNNILGFGAEENIINFTLEKTNPEFLMEAIKDIFKKSAEGKEDLIEKILSNKPNEIKDKLQTIINEILQDEINNPKIISEKYIPPIYVEKDILEWSYNFIKEQSIKFYEIFHSEVEQSKYSLNKSKAIEWLKKNHIDSHSWHTLSDLARKSRPFKDVKSAERQTLLKDLVQSGILKEETIDENMSYQYIPDD